MNTWNETYQLAQHNMPTPKPNDRPIENKKVSRMMSFSEAIEEILAGKKVTRLEWERVNEYVFLKEGFLSIHHYADKPEVTHRLLVSAGDMTATDWMIIEDEREN